MRVGLSEGQIRERCGLEGPDKWYLQQIHKLSSTEHIRQVGVAQARQDVENSRGCGKTTDVVVRALMFADNGSRVLVFASHTTNFLVHLRTLANAAGISIRNIDVVPHGTVVKHWYAVELRD